MEDRQRQLVSLIARATGESVINTSDLDDGQDFEFDDDVIEAELTFATQ